MIRIGYQGDVGSNNEAAALEFVKNNGWDIGDCELVPLIESRYVVSNLKANKVDYGIVATRNSVTGTVQ